LRVAQADDQLAFQYADRRRPRPVLAHDALHIAGKLEVLRAGEAVGEDGGFEGEERCIQGWGTRFGRWKNQSN
jgi:hypothetical protein